MTQPVNPYEPSAHAANPAPTSEQIVQNPQFQSRLTWPDRRILLRSIGQIRFAMVAIGVLWAKQMYDLATLVHSRWTSTDTANDMLGGFMALLALIVVAQGAVTIYACRLGWLAAEQLKAVAGGKSNSWSSWCHLHYQTAWCAAASGMLGLAAQIGNWLVFQAIVYNMKNMMAD